MKNNKKQFKLVKNHSQISNSFTLYLGTKKIADVYSQNTRQLKHLGNKIKLIKPL